MRSLLVGMSLMCAAPVFAGPVPNSDALFSGAVDGILTTTKLAAGAVQASMQEDELMDLLRDRDPQVRIAALKSARYEMGIHTNVRDRVMDMAKDAREETAVRREAARTLYYITNMSEPRDLLLDLAKRDREVPVRVMAYKALFLSSLNDSDVRDDIMDAAKREQDPAVRNAAIWALFDSNSDSDVTRLLKDIAGSYNEDKGARVEAIKSLFLAMNHSDVEDLMLDLAKSYNLDKDIRVPAIYALSAVAHNSDVERALQDLARSQNDVSIRMAAIKAQGGDVVFFRSYFHLGMRTHSHQYIPPIEDE